MPAGTTDAEGGGWGGGGVEEWRRRRIEYCLVLENDLWRYWIVLVAALITQASW